MIKEENNETKKDKRIDGICIINFNYYLLKANKKRPAPNGAGQNYGES